MIKMALTTNRRRHLLVIAPLALSLKTNPNDDDYYDDVGTYCADDYDDDYYDGDYVTCSLSSPPPSRSFPRPILIPDQRDTSL